MGDVGMTKEITYIVVCYDGHEIHVEKAFDSPEKAIDYAVEINKNANEGQGQQGYFFSVMKRVLMRWSANDVAR